MADRWMTYQELVEAMGCSAAAARALVLHRRWRQQTDNHGLARVLVPDGEDLSLMRARPDAPETHAHTAAEWLAHLAVLQAELVTLAQRAGAAEALVVELRADRDAWRAQAERLAQSQQQHPGFFARLWRLREQL